MNDVVINKIQSIQRCIQRAREEYKTAGASFKEDYTRQDAAVLNLTRACEQAIDLANYVIKTNHFGIPSSSGESFSLLADKQILPRPLSHRLIRMTGFRNVAVHQYQDLNIDIIISILTKDVEDLIHYTDLIMDFLE